MLLTIYVIIKINKYGILLFIKRGVKKMDNKINGIIMMGLGIILAVIYFALPAFIIYTFWLAVIVLIAYGAYMFQKKR